MHRSKALIYRMSRYFKPVGYDVKQIYPPHDTTCKKIVPLSTNRSIHRMIQSKHGKLKAYII
jgi:hypothetical protein